MSPDITSLAMFYGQDVSGGVNSLQGVVDGSGDDKVNIADVTRLQPTLEANARAIT